MHVASPTQPRTSKANMQARPRCACGRAYSKRGLRSSRSHPPRGLLWATIVALGILRGSEPVSCASAAALGAAASTETPVRQPCLAGQSGGPVPIGDRRGSQAADELRRTIEEGVLKKLSGGIKEHIARVEMGKRRPRPFVTLTYAQSIDGSIAAADKSQVLISGLESITMTHGLRSIHDGILVGAGTIRQDNPRLNVRHWPPEPSYGANSDSSSRDPGADAQREEPHRHRLRHSMQKVHASSPPRAVILADSLFQLPRCLRLGGAVVFTNLASPAVWRWLGEWASRGREDSQDEAANDFVIVHCRTGADGRCDLSDCLEKLYSMGFKSLMVEGGAAVISSFLRGCGTLGKTDMDDQSEQQESQLVDQVVITIAPVFLEGYNVLAKAASACDAPAEAPGFPLSIMDVSYVRLGRDLVVVGAPARRHDRLSPASRQDL